MDQRTDEWYAARLGKVTASRISDVLSKGKTGESASKATYRAELIAERLTRERAQNFVSAAMIWGNEYEPMARSAYELETGLIVTEVGFIDHPTVPMSGASPDGLVGDDGLVEIKCPGTKTHIDLLLNKIVPSKYIAQMQWQMACSGRAWADFVSFDPRMPEHLMIEVIRVARDQSFIDECITAVSAFLNDIAESINLLHSRVKKC